MRRRTMLLIFTAVMLSWLPARAAVTLAAGPPDLYYGSALNLHPIDYVINSPGATVSFAIVSSSHSGPISSLLSVTGTHTVTTPDPFELSLNYPLTLAAGDYRLIAFVEIPAGVPGPGGPTTNVIGMITMPFTLDEEATVQSIGASEGEDFAVYLIATPIPEPSSILLLGASAGILARRRRR